MLVKSSFVHLDESPKHYQIYTFDEFFDFIKIGKYFRLD